MSGAAAPPRGPSAPLSFPAAVAEVARLELLRSGRSGKIRLGLAFALGLPALVAAVHHLVPPGDDGTEATVAEPGDHRPEGDGIGSGDGRALPREGDDGPRPGAGLNDAAGGPGGPEADPSARSPAAAFDTGVRWAFFSLLVFAFPFLFGVGTVAEEVERRSLPYLLARPIPRRAVLLGKLLGGLLPTLGLLLLGLLLLALGLFLPEPAAFPEALPAVGRAAGALVALGLAYTAIAVCWSALAPDSATVLAAVHFGLVELLFGMAPGALRLASLNHHGRELAGVERIGLMTQQVPDLPAAVSLGLLLAAALAAGALAMELVRWSELRRSGAGGGAG
jgi:ABC-2 type transport system permease protein